MTSLQSGVGAMLITPPLNAARRVKRAQPLPQSLLASHVCALFARVKGRACIVSTASHGIRRDAMWERIKRLAYLWADLCCQYERWHEGDSAQPSQQDRVNQHKSLVIDPQLPVHTCSFAMLFDRSCCDEAGLCQGCASLSRKLPVCLHGVHTSVVICCKADRSQEAAA